MNQYCMYCKSSKDIDYFYQIIKRRTYGICCDDEGFEYYRKPTKMCLDCRVVSKDRVARYIEKKRKIKLND